MRASLISGILFFFVATSDAVTVDLSGAVVNEVDDSLPDMLVFLKSDPMIRCSTDINGVFHLSNGVGVLGGPSIHETGGSIRISQAGNGAGFLVQTRGIEQITELEIFKADGRRVWAAKVSGSSAVGHVVPFTGSGVYLVKISTVKGSRVFRLLPTFGAVTYAESHVAAAPHQRVLSKKTSFSLVDTLVVSGYKYRTTLFGLSSREQTSLRISAIQSNTWQNCSCLSLPKWHGMVKIRGTDYEFRDTCDFEMGQLCDTIWGRKDGRPTSDFEQPVHTVCFTHNFLMDTTEISQGEFDTVMKSYTGYSTPAKWTALYGKGSNYPAYAVSWDDAVLFCNARSKRDHFDTAYTYAGIVGTPGSKCRLVGVNFELFSNGYRLPTEAEWEYCGRAGMREDYWWAKNWQDYKDLDTIEAINEYAIWAQNSWNFGSGNPGFGTHPVDSADPGRVGGELGHNYYDLAGMYGNVSEWCNDLVGAPYEWGTVTNPTGPAWTSDTTRQHVIRGGNWGSTIFYLRGASRYFYAPGEDKDVFIGFRTVRVIGDNEEL